MKREDGASAFVRLLRTGKLSVFGIYSRVLGCLGTRVLDLSTFTSTTPKFRR
jgi:hypothetical protein